MSNQAKPNVQLEDPQTIGRKAQIATKALADSIGNKYILKNVNVNVQGQTPPGDVDRALKALADAIGHKYVFMKEKQGSPDGLLVSEVRGQPKVSTTTREQVRGSYTGNRPDTFNVRTEEAHLMPQMVDKNFEVLIENPVVREIIVEKPYDVIVEKPVENRIEREVVVERMIDNPIERIIERPVERIIRKNVEVVVERPVVFEEYVDKIYENVIENRYDVIRENVVTEQVVVDNHIEKTVLKPFRNEVQVKEIIKEVPVRQDIYVEKPVERVVQRIVDQPYDVFVDREVIVERPVEVRQDVVTERRVERPYQKVVDVQEVKKVKRSIVVEKSVDVYIDVIKQVDKPFRRTVDRIVDKPVIQERIVEDVRDIIVEKPVYVDKRVEVKRNVEVDREYIVDRVVDKEVVQYVEVPVHVQRSVEVPVEKRVAKYVEVLTEKIKDVDVVKEVVIPVERIVEKVIRRDKIIPKTIEVEKMVEFPVDKYVDKIFEVEKVVQVPKYVDKIVEKKVDKIVERRVEVIVEKFVEVPREVYVDKIIEVETVIEKPVYQERHIQETHDVLVLNDRNVKIGQEIQETAGRIRALQREYEEITVAIRQLQKYDLTTTSHMYQENRIGDEENGHLREILNQLHDEFNVLVEEHNRQFVEQHGQGYTKKGLGRSTVVQNPGGYTTTVQGAPPNVQMYNGQKKSFATPSSGKVVQSSVPYVLDQSHHNESIGRPDGVVIYGGNDSSILSRGNNSNRPSGVQYGNVLAQQNPSYATSVHRVSAHNPAQDNLEGSRTFRPTLQGSQVQRLSSSKSPVRVSSSGVPSYHVGPPNGFENVVHRVSNSPTPQYVQSAKGIPHNVYQNQPSNNGQFGGTTQSHYAVPSSSVLLGQSQTHYQQGPHIYASNVSYDTQKNRAPFQNESRVISGSTNRPPAPSFPNTAGFPAYEGDSRPNLSTITESNPDSFRTMNN